MRREFLTNPFGRTARRILSVGLLVGGISCGANKDSALTGSSAAVLTTVQITLSPATIQVGQTSVATASGIDQNGNAIALGAVAWSSGSQAIATTSGSTTASGVVSGVAPGQAQISATTGGKQGVQSITVVSIPIASLTVSPVAATLAIGGTQQLSATALDANGGVITGQSIVWNSSDATKASVSSSGLVTGAALGSATISATTGGKTSTASITVSAQPVASVVISPPSASFKIASSQTLTANALDVNGNILNGQTFAWSSSSSNIVSGTAALNFYSATGLAVGVDTVTVSAGGKSATSVLTILTNATSVNLSVAGQSTAFLDAPNPIAAVSVQPGSQYLIAVVNTDQLSTTLEDFTLSTTFTGTASGGILPRSSTRVARAPVSSPTPRGATFEIGDQTASGRNALRMQAQNHMDVLEDNRRIFARYGNPRDAWARTRAQGDRFAAINASVAQTIGAVSKLYVRKALNASCNAVDSIYARTVAIGQHVIVLADTNRTTWPQSFRPDSSFYQTFANEYDQITYPMLLNYAGNPLVMDATLSGAGKVAVTITPALSSLGGVSGGSGTYVGMVSGCDFFPNIASGPNTFYSNQTEMLYLLTPSATIFGSAAQWELAIRSVAAHESKHIVSFGTRAAIGGIVASEEAWLEEGLAQVASEIWERNFSQATWKGNATFNQTLGCEFNFSSSGISCDASGDKPRTLSGGHLAYLFQYLQRESSLNNEGLSVDGLAYYGAGWAFARWTIDQYAPAGAEGAFIKSLISTTQSGLNNLSSHTGQSIPTLLTYWNVASAVFQKPSYTAADIRTTIPSFNLADIFFNGQTNITCGGAPCQLFMNGSPPLAFPVAPIAFDAGNYSKSVHGVPGTSASFFLMSGSTAGTETIQLLSGTGAALSASSGFRVLILRVQ